MCRKVHYILRTDCVSVCRLCGSSTAGRFLLTMHVMSGTVLCFLLVDSAGYEHTFVSDGEVSGSSSGSEFEPGGYQRRRGKKAKQRRGNNNGSNRVTSSPSDFTRTTGRSRGVVNYKDFYGGSEGEGEDEAGEGAEGETPVPAVEDNRETIERILKKRVGLVGG